jgi:hypothetical protein
METMDDVILSAAKDLAHTKSLSLPAACFALAGSKATISIVPLSNGRKKSFNHKGHEGSRRKTTAPSWNFVSFAVYGLLPEVLPLRKSLAS